MNDPYGTLPPRPIEVDKNASGQPQCIGRYRIERVLGEGGFGVVYLAHDEQLHRFVAIKVPHTPLLSRPEDADAYLTEARTVAGLDHPNIVPVYDVGSAEGYPCYVVSKFIEGSTLAQRIKANRPSVTEATEKDELLDKLWAVAEAPEKGKESQRLRAPRRWPSTTRRANGGARRALSWSMTSFGKTRSSWANGAKRSVR
jgi:hypothetical protein